MPAPEAEKLIIDFDLSHLTIGDLLCIEEATGEATEDFIKRVSAQKKFTPDAKTITAIVLIALRKKNPNATLLDARSVELTSLTSPTAPEVAEPADPTTPSTDVQDGGPTGAAA